MSDDDTELVCFRATERSRQALARAHERTGRTRTQVINRALQVYEAVEAELDSGFQLVAVKTSKHWWQPMTTRRIKIDGR